MRFQYIDVHLYLSKNIYKNIFISTSSDAVSCGGRKKYPPYIMIVQITFSGPFGSSGSFGVNLKIAFCLRQC